MKPRLQLVTAPAGDPVTLAEAKAQCRVDHDNHDTLIGSLIKAATAHIDGPTGILGHCIVEQTWDLKLDDFPKFGGRIKLPVAPLISVSSITYVDTAGDSQTLSASAYKVINGGARRSVIEEAYGYSWPTTRDESDAVTVRFVGGYEADDSGSPVDYTANVPAPIRQAILIMVAEMYENRESSVIGYSVDTLRTMDSLLGGYQSAWL